MEYIYKRSFYKSFYFILHLQRNVLKPPSLPPAQHINCKLSQIDNKGWKTILTIIYFDFIFHLDQHNIIPSFPLRFSHFSNEMSFSFLHLAFPFFLPFGSSHSFRWKRRIISIHLMWWNEEKK